jgi:hypothetical protein
MPKKVVINNSRIVIFKPVKNYYTWATTNTSVFHKFIYLLLPLSVIVFLSGTASIRLFIYYPVIQDNFFYKRSKYRTEFVNIMIDSTDGVLAKKEVAILANKYYDIRKTIWILIKDKDFEESTIYISKHLDTFSYQKKLGWSPTLIDKMSEGIVIGLNKQYSKN